MTETNHHGLTIGDSPNRIDRDHRGDLDDIVIVNVTMFRMEWMDNNSVWIKCYRDGGPSDVVFWLNATAGIAGSCELEASAGKKAEETSPLLTALRAAQAMREAIRDCAVGISDAPTVQAADARRLGRLADEFDAAVAGMDGGSKS